MGCIEDNGVIKLTLDQSVLDAYNKYYFEDETKYDNSTFVLSKSCRFAINIYNIDKYISWTYLY